MTIKVDLLPTEKKRFGLDPLVIVLFLFVVLATVAMFMWSKKLENEISIKRNQIAEVEKQIKDLEAQLPVLEERQNRIKKLKEQIQIIKTLVYDPVRYANLLTQITMALPDNVFLESLTIDPGKTQVNMNGKAAEVGGTLPLATISQLMKNLNDTEYFRGASLSSATRDKGEGIPSFDFTIDVSYDSQAAADPAKKPMPPGSTPAPQATPNPAATPTDAGVPVQP
jgi:Tfp pilus assembly protein PilN